LDRSFHFLGCMTRRSGAAFNASGKAVVNIGIATNVAGLAEFHDVVAWEKAPEVIATVTVARAARSTWEEDHLAGARCRRSVECGKPGPLSSC